MSDSGGCESQTPGDALKHNNIGLTDCSDEEGREEPLFGSEDDERKERSRHGVFQQSCESGPDGVSFVFVYLIWQRRPKTTISSEFVEDECGLIGKGREDAGRTKSIKIWSNELFRLGVVGDADDASEQEFVGDEVVRIATVFCNRNDVSTG